MNDENFALRIDHSTLILICVPILLVLLGILFTRNTGTVVPQHEASAIADVSIAAINAVAAAKPSEGVPWWIVGLAVVVAGAYTLLQTHYRGRVALAQAQSVVQPTPRADSFQPPVQAPRMTLEQLLALAAQYGFRRYYNKAGEWILVSKASGARLTAAGFMDALGLDDGGEYSIVRSEQ